MSPRSDDRRSRLVRGARLANPLRPPTFLAPAVYDRSGVFQERPTQVPSGLTMVSSFWRSESAPGEWRPGLRLLDGNGRTLHAWTFEPDEIFPDSANRTDRPANELHLHGFHLFANGDVLANFDYLGLVRADACGEVEWSLPVGAHHALSVTRDGSVWVPALTRRPRRSTPDHRDGLPGLEGPVYQDVILQVSPGGEVVGSTNVLDLLYANGLARYLVRGASLAREDPLHVNDVEPLDPDLAADYPLFEAGDLLVSMRNIHLVLVFDPTSGEVRWHASDPFIMQHDPDFLGDGWIGVFDNNFDGTFRGSMLGGSRIVAIRPGDDSVKVLFPTAESDPFYTPIMGKWQELENGDLLLTEARAGRVLEVARDGTTVWEWVQERYDEEHVPEVTEGARYDLTADEVLDWPCTPRAR